ncbi:MAG: tetratricopeptide repeat protein [Chloroflexi bacterium]|nr:tetratricopeptide repeat protein [Chloroflexota bacterium]
MSTLQRAISLARSGHADKACAILRDLVEANPRDIYAWLWLAEYSPDADEAATAARHVLSLRPTNQRAYEVLQNLGEPPFPYTTSRSVLAWFSKPKRKLAVDDSVDEPEEPWLAGIGVLVLALLVTALVFIVFGLMIL